MRPNEAKGSGNEKSKVALGLWRTVFLYPACTWSTYKKANFFLLIAPSHASFALSLGCVLRLLFLDIFCLPYKALGIIYNVLATQAYKPTLSINWVVLGTSWLNNLVFAFFFSLVYFCFFPLYWQIISPSERFDRVLLNKGNTSLVRALVRSRTPPPPRFLTSPPYYDYTEYS